MFTNTKKTLKSVAGTLSLAFFIAASAGGAATPAQAARNTEPYSCTVQYGPGSYNPRQSSITIDAKTGEILSGDRVDEQRPPASMTKMMTAALIFEALRDGRIKLTDQITVKNSPDVEATHGESGSTWLGDGTTMTVEQAIKAILVASANNVAVIMAEHLDGTQQDFVDLMNERAQDIGMTNTHFANPHGLPDPAQLSTARDMAKLALYLQREFPQYYHFFSAPEARFGPHVKRNHNEVDVKNNYIDGMKTGFICASGFNVTVSGYRGTDRVISVVFGGRTPYQRDTLAKSLVDGGLKTLNDRDQGRRGASKPGSLGYIHDNEPATLSESNNYAAPAAPSPL